MPPRRLDLLIPSFNRIDTLRLALSSVTRAEHPGDLAVRVTVVDNGSTDGTAALVKEWASNRGSPEIRWLLEPTPGKVHALNRGIAETDGDLVGMIDDDEQLDERWFAVVAREFADGGTDFIGGPSLLRWPVPPPPWLPKAYGAVIGLSDCGRERQRYRPDWHAQLPGGNAVVSRAALQRVGPYDRRIAARAVSRWAFGEDQNMSERLLAAGATGWYVPDLVVYHHLFADRLTKRYHRRWSFRHAVSAGSLPRPVQTPTRTPLVANVPRWRWAMALRGCVRACRPDLSPDERFEGELRLWELAGYVVGARRRARDEREAGASTPSQAQFGEGHEGLEAKRPEAG